MLRGFQQDGKGIMFRGHQGLGKRHNAQGPLIGWARGLKFIRDRQQIGKGIMLRGLQQLGKGIMSRGHQELGKWDNAQGPPTD